MELATALSSVDDYPSVSVCVSMFGFPDALKTPVQHHLSKNVRKDELEKKRRKTKSIDTLKQSIAISNGPNSVKYYIWILRQSHE
jgi:hypothetical protein